MATLTLRVPDDLHRKLKEVATADHRSLNAEIVALLEDAIRVRIQKPKR